MVMAFLFFSGCDSDNSKSGDIQPLHKRIEADWLTHEESTLRKTSLSHIQYFLQLDISKAQRFTGNVEIRFVYKPSKEDLTIDFVDGEAERILVNNTPIAIDYSGYFISIPSRFLDAGSNIIKIQYSHNYSDNGSGLYRYTDPTDNKTYLYTHFEPYDANKLFPVFDQPNLRATYTLKVVAPKAWTVVSSVRESEIISDGPYNRWSFPESQPISSYIFPLHAGPWHIWESKAGNVPLRLMSRESIAPLVNVREWFKITRQGIDFFNIYFDIKYPFDKYDQLIVPDFNIGGMENVAAVTFTERYVPRGPATKAEMRNIADTILHELSHMWFGDLVTIDWWSSLWLKESFASFMAPLALAEATDYKDAWRAFTSRVKSRAYLADQRVTTHPIDMEVTDTKSGDASFDSITYNKGASVLQQLSYYLGKDTFRHGIRLYLKENQYKAAKLDDFFDALTRASGLNLNSWKSNWINQAGVNTVKADYQCVEGKISQFKLLQSSSEEYPFIRTHRLQLGLYHLDEDDKVSAFKVLSTEIDNPSTEISQVEGLECPLLVFPNHDDWDYSKIELDKKTQLMLPDNISKIKDDLLRAMFWQTSWDQVLDIKVPVSNYLEMVSNNLDKESDAEILNLLLSNVETAKYWLVSDSKLSPKQNQLFSMLEQQILKQSLKTEQSTDLQSLWFQHFLNMAQSVNSLNHIAKWLRLKASPENLANNQDIRWKALIILSVHDHPATDALLKLEKLRDRSDHSLMMEIAVKASKPDLQTKQNWLDELMKSEGRQTAARLKMSLEYLFPVQQKALQANFIDIIFADLHDLDASRGQEIVEHFVENSLPMLCTSESVHRLEKENNNTFRLGLIARKGLKIALQEDQRCVAINTLDEQ